MQYGFRNEYSTPTDWRVDWAYEPGDWIEMARTAVSDVNPARRLFAIALIRDRLPRIEEDAVAHGISDGMSWSRIAHKLAVSRQAVHKRYGPGRTEELIPRRGADRIAAGVRELQNKAWIDDWGEAQFAAREAERGDA